MGSLKTLFVTSHQLGCPQALNGYFRDIFQDMLNAMYRDDIHHANEIQNVSDAINDITDFCDAQNLASDL